MKYTLLMVLGLVLVASGCGSKKQETPAKPTNAPSASADHGNPLNAPAQYLGALNQAQKLANKTIDTASIDKAIQLFNVQEERFPKDLQELVTQHYLPSLPQVPYGMKFDYNPRTGQFRVLPAPPAPK